MPPSALISSIASSTPFFALFPYIAASPVSGPLKPSLTVFPSKPESVPQPTNKHMTMAAAITNAANLFIFNFSFQIFGVRKHLGTIQKSASSKDGADCVYRYDQSDAGYLRHTGRCCSTSRENTTKIKMMDTDKTAPIIIISKKADAAKHASAFDAKQDIIRSAN